MAELRSWKSNKANNYFAPQFNVDMWFDNIPIDLIDLLLKIVKEKENLYQNDRWQHYNIFDWEYESIINLKQQIKNSYSNFLSSINLEVEKPIWIRGWVYPQKRNMLLQRHYHAIHENSFISGNLCLTKNNTSTDYDIPYIGWVKIKNEKGMMTLFPSCLPHAVDVLQDNERYSIAFDLITEVGMNYFWKNNRNVQDPLCLATRL